VRPARWPGGHLATWPGRAAARRGRAGRALARAAGHDGPIVDGLCRCASLEAARGRCKRAARLFAADGAWRAATGDGRSPNFIPLPETSDRDLAATRVALGAETFARAWAEGEAMPLEQAVAYALEDAPAPRAARRPNVTDGVSLVIKTTR
jgi:hypothetical protein